MDQDLDIDISEYRMGILEDLNKTIKLNNVLEIFSKELKKEKDLDGFMIYLFTGNFRSLKCYSIELPKEFENIKSSYLGSETYLGDENNINTEAFIKRKNVISNIDCGSEFF